MQNRQASRVSRDTPAAAGDSICAADLEKNRKNATGCDKIVSVQRTPEHPQSASKGPVSTQTLVRIDTFSGQISAEGGTSSLPLGAIPSQPRTACVAISCFFNHEESMMPPLALKASSAKSSVPHRTTLILLAIFVYGHASSHRRTGGYEKREATNGTLVRLQNSEQPRHPLLSSFSRAPMFQQ